VPRVALAVLILTLSACVGRYTRAYPRWTLSGGRDLRAGCAIADAFVRKSGKEGIGVTLELRSTHDCDVRITDVALVFPDGARARGDAPPPSKMIGRSLAYLWIPIRFDGDRVWNDELLHADLVLALDAGDAHGAWKIAATERQPEQWHDTWANSPWGAR
jgi:hypothetical protein